MSTRPSPNEPYTSLSNSQIRSLVKNALIMTEVSTNLRDNYRQGERHISYLKDILERATAALSALQSISKSSLLDTRKMLKEALAWLADLDEKEAGVIERLLSLVEAEIAHFGDARTEDGYDSETFDLKDLPGKIRHLEGRKQSDGNLPGSLSSRNVKCDIDEKYPENWSRDSLIDLNSVVNLPPVPEDIFSSVSSINRPTRSSSLSSLKSMRKVKLFLQKAESSDDEDNSSDTEDQLVYGDNEECCKPPHSPSTKKLLLGNIKEESQD